MTALELVELSCRDVALFAERASSCRNRREVLGQMWKAEDRLADLTDRLDSLKTQLLEGKP